MPLPEEGGGPEDWRDRAVARAEEAEARAEAEVAALEFHLRRAGEAEERAKKAEEKAEKNKEEAQLWYGRAAEAWKTADEEFQLSKLKAQAEEAKARVVWMGHRHHRWKGVTELWPGRPQRWRRPRLAVLRRLLGRKAGSQFRVQASGAECALVGEQCFDACSCLPSSMFDGRAASAKKCTLCAWAGRQTGQGQAGPGQAR